MRTADFFRVPWWRKWTQQDGLALHQFCCAALGWSLNHLEPMVQPHWASRVAWGDWMRLASSKWQWWKHRVKQGLTNYSQTIADFLSDDMILKYPELVSEVLNCHPKFHVKQCSQRICKEDAILENSDGWKPQPAALNGPGPLRVLGCLEKVSVFTMQGKRSAKSQRFWQCWSISIATVVDMRWFLLLLTAEKGAKSVPLARNLNTGTDSNPFKLCRIIS